MTGPGDVGRQRGSQDGDARHPPPGDRPLSYLTDLHRDGRIADIDIHFATLVAELDGGGGPELPLAAALASARTREGHACLSLPEITEREWPQDAASRLPAIDGWIEALDSSPVVARPGAGGECPLVLDGRGRLYLERLWTAEQSVANGLLGLSTGPATPPEPVGLDAALDRLFPRTGPDDRTRAAARTAACRRLCVVSGGPGTGKTTVAARIVALLLELGLAAPGRIALAAPTGKAAARLQEAVRRQHRELAARAPALEGYEALATTVHRWLLARGRDARLARPIDALILDEGSMVDLVLMARVLDGLPDGARLVVLGDASQLASVQPGAVFADLCRAGTGSTGTPSASEASAAVAEADGNKAGSEAPPVGDGAGILPASPDTGGKGGGRGQQGSVDVGAGTVGSDVAAGGVGPDSEDRIAAGIVPDRGFDARSDGTDCEPVSSSSPLAPCAVALEKNWRFDPTGGIGRLAAAVVRGDASAALAALLDPSDGAVELRLLSDADRFAGLATRFADQRFVPALRARAAMREPGDTPEPLSSFRVLCAHRVGPFGAARFNRVVERRLRALGLVQAHDAFYPGRPILVTRNDPRTGLSNGDTGVVLRDADDRIRVWFPELGEANGRHRLVSPSRLPPHESFFAVTVHRAQGSEFDEVAVVLGPAESRVATRELLYTAVTRARRRVVVYGAEYSVAAAVERMTVRSSGLRDALVRPVASG